MNSPLAVFVAHSGKTVELAVVPQARVEAVQQTLADLTGIAKADQILMCEGARLDGARQLSAYGLPLAGEGKVPDVFLYSRAHLRADAPLPPPEALPECPLDLSGLEGIRAARHRLDSAGSPLLRALPDYQRQFQEHLLQATARHEASQQRMATCARLVSEQEVQALSIDAATSNVEAHYAYICDAFQAFMQRYAQQAAAHADVLARFESDLRYLASVELHPALRTSTSSLSGSGSGGGGGTAAATAVAPASPASSTVSAASAAGGSSSLGGAPTLLQLVDAPVLREAAAAASRGHAHFSGKVAELEGLFGSLKAELEALFMQAPSVDLEALTRQLEEMHGQVDDQASIVAALSSDLGKVAQLVEQAGEALASDPAASVQVSDAIHMLETMHETHVAHLLPRVAACHEAVEAFATNCLACKNALTRDVFSQLRTISSQQSKIREMKNRLALFREALGRQEASVQELLVVRRVPAAYKQCLAECVRREAFMEKYAHSAAQLAERMGAFREKELAMRDAFRKHVEQLIPAQLLERMGLLEQPPHCQVSVSAAEGERLLPVTVDDVRRIQLPWSTTSLLPPAHLAAAASPTPAGASAAGAGPSGSARGSREASAEPRQLQPTAEAAPAQAAEVDITASLQLENAKLRAELASQIALDCIRTAQLAAVSGSLAGLAPAPQQLQQQGSAGTSGHTSPQLAQSLAASAAQASSMAAASTAISAAGAALPPDAAQRFERALAAKDSLVSELQVQLSGARQQVAGYEARIGQLETQLGSLAAAADGRAQEPLLAGSGVLAAHVAAQGAAVGPAAPAALLAPPEAAAAAAGPTASSQGLQPGSGAGHSSSAGGSGGVSLPASPSAQTAGTAAAMEGALSASITAATGFSLAGYLHSADSASQSLGPSSSLDPPEQHAQRRVQRQAQEPQQAPQERQELPSQQPPTQQPPAKSPAAARSGLQTEDEAELAATAAAVGQDAASIEQPAAGAAAAVGPERAFLFEQSAEEPPAAPVPPHPTAAAEAAPALQAVHPDPAAEAAPAPQPPQLLASMKVDEGSDVEGIEPVSDSEYESGDEQPSADGEQERPPAAAVPAAQPQPQPQPQPQQQQSDETADDEAHDRAVEPGGQPPTQ